jgi:mevalonate kinase
VPPLNENTGELPAESYEKVKNYSLLFEKFMHGNPSGIDNAVATYGMFLSALLLLTHN